MAIVSIENERLMQIVGDLVCNCDTHRDIIRQAFKIPDGKNVVSVLLESGKFRGIEDVAATLAKAFPPPGGQKWSDLAKWVMEYEKFENRASPV